MATQKMQRIICFYILFGVLNSYLITSPTREEKCTIKQTDERVILYRQEEK